VASLVIGRLNCAVSGLAVCARSAAADGSGTGGRPRDPGGPGDTGGRPGEIGGGPGDTGGAGRNRGPGGAIVERRAYRPVDGAGDAGGGAPWWPAGGRGRAGGPGSSAGSA
jgi:hypothetical protein